MTPAEKFFLKVWDAVRDGTLDDYDVQGWMIDLGLLKKVPVTEPCGEGCWCADWDEFPQDCYRPTVGKEEK